MSEAISTLLAAQPRSSALPERRRNKAIGTPGAPNRPVSLRSEDREEQIATDRLPPRRGEQLAKTVRPAGWQRPPREESGPGSQGSVLHKPSLRVMAGPDRVRRGWSALDQAIRVTDLLLQAGGFSLLLLDLGSTPPEMSWRIPLATWFRFRAACDRTRTSLLILSQHPCARSSAELVLRLDAGRTEAQGAVLTGISYRAALERQRFGSAAMSNVVSIRKPVQRELSASWKGSAAWAIRAS